MASAKRAVRRGRRRPQLRAYVRASGGPVEGWSIEHSPTSYMGQGDDAAERLVPTMLRACECSAASVGEWVHHSRHVCVARLSGMILYVLSVPEVDQQAYCPLRRRVEQGYVIEEMYCSVHLPPHLGSFNLPFPSDLAWRWTGYQHADASDPVRPVRPSGTTSDQRL